MSEPLNVFLSYAHEDEPHRETLGKHLSTLEREGLIRIWHDRQITGGREWAGLIDDKLKDSDIVLLLISPDFLASGYCNDVELAEAIRMHEDETKRTRVVPVILRSCDWEKSAFACFNALPPDGTPAVEAKYPDQQFKAIAQGLRAIVAELRGIPGRESGQREALAMGAPSGARPKRRTIPIGEINLGIVKLGPFELPLPAWGAWAGVKVLGLAALLLALAGAGTWFFALRGPIADARDAMRMARYDLAQDSLANVPRWLSTWPAVKTMRKKADLGTGFQKQGQDWEELGRDLRRLRTEWPADADLMVLEATYWWHREDYVKARILAAAAAKADEGNAEAWFLLGLDRDLAGDVLNAESDYRAAVKVAPDSPQYRSNLARILLDSGRFDQAIREYRKINDFPLARLEQALGHWATGEIDFALGAQRDALKMLGDTALMGNYYNRRAWVFRLDNMGVRLASLDDRRCYARLEEAASRRLGGDTAAAFPPATCGDPPREIRQLVADDLCRFVDAHQPGLVEMALQLHAALKQPATCPEPEPPQDLPAGKLS